jgi:hypothetical protein
MRLWLSGLIVLLLAGCQVHPFYRASPKELPSLRLQQGQPLLALADHLLRNYYASDVVSQPTVCLAVNDGREGVALPPQDERALMMRHVRLSPFSRCIRDGLSVVDGETGAPALVFALHSFTCADASHCTGFSGYDVGDQQALSSLHRMTWDGAAWQFEQNRRLIGGSGG